MNCHNCKKELKHVQTNVNDYHKIKDHFYFGGKYRVDAHGIFSLKSSIPKYICVIFHNGSNYGYYFIMKQLAKEFRGESNFLRKNTEK